MIYIAICDDEPKFIDKFFNVIMINFKMMGVECQITCFGESNNFIEYMRKQAVDLVFLGIDIPRFNGIEIARILRSIGKECPIVLVSDQDEYVFQSFEIRPLYFLRKQKIEQEIIGLIDIFMKQYGASKINFLIKEDGLIKKISLKKIIYFKSIRNNTEVYTENQIYLIKESLTVLETKYDKLGFIRVDKGSLVNANYVERLDKDRVVLTNNEEIYVSRRRYKQVKLNLQQFVKKDYEELEAGLV